MAEFVRMTASSVQNASTRPLYATRALPFTVRERTHFHTVPTISTTHNPLASISASHIDTTLLMKLMFLFHVVVTLVIVNWFSHMTNLGSYC